MLLRETNLIRLLIARLENSYCSITVANHQLITTITFVVKSYTHPWKGFANKLRLVLHACKILFSEIVCYDMIGKTKQGLNASTISRVAYSILILSYPVAKKKAASNRDESGNGKIPYRLTPYPDFTDRILHFREKTKSGKKNRENLVKMGTKTVEGFSRPNSRIPYFIR